MEKKNKHLHFRNKSPKTLVTHNYWYLSDDTAIVRCARKKHQWAQESDLWSFRTTSNGSKPKEIIVDL